MRPGHHSQKLELEMKRPTHRIRGEMRAKIEKIYGSSFNSDKNRNNYKSKFPHFSKHPMGNYGAQTDLQRLVQQRTAPELLGPANSAPIHFSSALQSRSEQRESTFYICLPFLLCNIAGNRPILLRKSDECIAVVTDARMNV